LLATVSGPLNLKKAMNTLAGKRGAEYMSNVILILLFAVAALWSMAKDLDRMHEAVSMGVHLRSELLAAGVTSVNATSFSRPENEYASEPPAHTKSSDEFRWTGRVASGQAIEIKGLNGDIDAQPAAGDQIEVIANKKSRRSDSDEVRIQVVEHSNGVTICAVYPNEDASQPNICVPGPGERHRNQSVANVRNNVRNNDVRVDFKVRVPAGVEFIGQTVNGEIAARSLASNVESRTVNGSINISTTGYAQAKTVNGEISASLGNTNWPGLLEFRTINGEINVSLPPSLSTVVNADTFNGGISSDFPLASSQTVSTKRLRGIIGVGGRELILKTLNGSINLHRTN
jgi:hypothetical protein